MDINVRPMYLHEIGRMIDYFHTSDRDSLLKMGVYAPNLPEPAGWLAALQSDFAKPTPERAYFYTTWEVAGRPVGHCNVNFLTYGQQAKMHLHMWQPPQRQQGFGSELVKRSVALFFSELKLQKLFCEPNAHNPAPNKTLAKAGFRYLFTHETTPGPFNFHQPVTRWVYQPE